MRTSVRSRSVMRLCAVRCEFRERPHHDEGEECDSRRCMDSGGVDSRICVAGKWQACTPEHRVERARLVGSRIVCCRGRLSAEIETIGADSLCDLTAFHATIATSQKIGIGEPDFDSEYRGRSPCREIICT
jgi:hypothetical protein